MKMDIVESDLIEENKRLKKLAHNLQQEIERHVLSHRCGIVVDTTEIHPMEDK
tara:strand:+ start:233 stop:391 length:159 start_codon:yes stop_codon:yes gene_type:complete